MLNDVKALGAIATTAVSTIGSGSVTVATITTPASGLLGLVGFTTTTTVALPIAGIIVVAGLVGFEFYKGFEAGGDSK